MQHSALCVLNGYAPQQGKASKKNSDPLYSNTATDTTQNTMHKVPCILLGCVVTAAAAVEGQGTRTV